MINKSYKFRIYPTKEQEQTFVQFFGAKRWIYNHYLSTNKDKFSKKEKHLSNFDINLDINASLNILNIGQTDVYDCIIPQETSGMGAIPASLQKYCTKNESSMINHSCYREQESFIPLGVK